MASACCCHRFLELSCQEIPQRTKAGLIGTLASLCSIFSMPSSLSKQKLTNIVDRGNKGRNRGDAQSNGEKSTDHDCECNRLRIDCSNNVKVVVVMVLQQLNDAVSSDLDRQHDFADLSNPYFKFEPEPYWILVTLIRDSPHFFETSLRMSGMNSLWASLTLLPAAGKEVQGRCQTVQDPECTFSTVCPRSRA